MVRRDECVEFYTKFGQDIERSLALPSFLYISDYVAVIWNKSKIEAKFRTFWSPYNINYEMYGPNVCVNLSCLAWDPTCNNSTDIL